MDGIEKEKKKITLSIIVRYIFGAIFLLFAVAEIGLMNYVSGLIFILVATVTIKPTMDYLEKRLNFSLSKAAQFFVVFCLVVVAFAAIPDTPATVTNTDIISSPQSSVSGTETAEAKDEQTQATSSAGSISIVGTNYKCGSWSDEQYPLIRLFGEDYVPLYPSNEKIWSAHVDKLAKLILDLPEEGEKYSIRANEILDLGQGYCLEPKQIDVDKQMVWFEFSKDGEHIADDIVKIGSGNEGTLSVNFNDIQGISNVVVFKAHVSDIFQYETNSIVMIDGIWLIDYAHIKTLKLGDKFGEFTLKKITNGVDESNPGYLVFEHGDTQSDVQATLSEETTTEGNSIDNQETSSVPEPTSQSEQVSEHEPIELTGNGPEATPVFRLQEGLSKFTMTHDGSSNFVVWLMDGESGQKIELLVNEIGSFDGSKAIGITSEGDYILDVTADGPWKVVIEQPRQAATQSTPLTLSGTGQKVSGMFYLENGLKRFQMKHDGSSNFAVWLMDNQGNKIELLANEIGNFNGSKAVGITESGTYLLDIQADGNWKISIE